MAVLATLEGFLERLGVVLAHFGRILDASWTVLEESWELLGGLEASWQRLGSHLGDFEKPSWGCLEGLGPEKTCKRGTKSMSRGLPILTLSLE